MLLAEGRLRSIPGIGAAIEKKIADYAATGSVPLHERLLEEMPVGVLELLAVPGLGPRRARAAYKEAGIDSLNALEAAAMDGTLRTISGFGPKSVDAIVAALDQVRKHAGRHLGYEARALAKILAGRLRARDDVAAAEVAGDLRRAVEIVDDVVLVAAADEPGPVIDAFCDHPMTAEVLSRSRGGMRAGSVRLSLGGGLVARLVVVSAGCVRRRARHGDRLGGARERAAGGRAEEEAAFRELGPRRPSRRADRRFR